jgi:regulator of nucleoside diphosphate kinase
MFAFPSQPRVMTELDHVRISRLLRQPPAGVWVGPGAIEDVIDGAELVSSYEVPPHVVTMYSQVLIADMQTGEQRKIILCYPHDAEPATGSVSVLSPVGAALLGLSVGQVAHWAGPQGARASAQIRAVLFQPEESGDCLL